MFDEIKTLIFELTSYELELLKANLSQAETDWLNQSISYCKCRLANLGLSDTEVSNLVQDEMYNDYNMGD